MVAAVCAVVAYQRAVAQQQQVGVRVEQGAARVAAEAVDVPSVSRCRDRLVGTTAARAATLSGAHTELKGLALLEDLELRRLADGGRWTVGGGLWRGGLAVCGQGIGGPHLSTPLARIDDIVLVDGRLGIGPWRLHCGRLGELVLVVLLAARAGGTRLQGAVGVRRPSSSSVGAGSGERAVGKDGRGVGGEAGGERRRWMGGWRARCGWYGEGYWDMEPRPGMVVDEVALAGWAEDSGRRTKQSTAPRLSLSTAWCGERGAKPRQQRAKRRPGSRV